MAVDLVKLDASALNDALYLSADAIRTVYGMLANRTLNPAYAAAAIAQYQFKDSGFQDAIYDLIDAIANEAGGDGGTSIPDLNGRKVAIGTFTVTSSSTATYTVTHDLGVVPELGICISEGFTKDETGGANAAPFWGLDTKRIYTSRFNSSGTLLITAGSISTAEASTTTTKITTSGYHLMPNVPYYWMLIGPAPST